MRTRARTVFDLALTLLFSSILVTPALIGAVRGEPERKRLPEERPIAPWPEIPSTFWTLGEFPSGFEAWLGDRLGLRDELLRLRSRLYVTVLGVAPTPRIELGTDTCVFLTDGLALDVARGVRPMSRADLESWRVALEARAQWCRERHIAYVFALVPEKSAIYPEHLRAGRERLGPTRLDQLVSYVNPRGKVEVLDLRAGLLDEKKRDADGDHVYFRLGSHWTDRGAWRSYAAILERLVARFPTLSRKPMESLHWVSSQALGDTWAERLYLSGILMQTERHMLDLPDDSVTLVEASGAIGDHVVYETKDHDAPRLVMLHDSYGEPLRRLLPAHFSRSVFEWGRDFRPAPIEHETPDVVIEVLAERVLARRPALTLPAQAAELASAYERSTSIVYRLDATRDAPFLASRGGVEVKPSSGELAIEWTSDGTGLRLPAITTPGDVIVRVELTVPADEGLTVYYLTTTEPEYSRARSLGYSLTAGRNVVHVDLSIADRTGPMLVRFGSKGETATLHALEARAIQ